MLQTLYWNQKFRLKFANVIIWYFGQQTSHNDVKRFHESLRIIHTDFFSMLDG